MKMTIKRSGLFVTLEIRSLGANRSTYYLRTLNNGQTTFSFPLFRSTVNSNECGWIEWFPAFDCPLKFTCRSLCSHHTVLQYSTACIPTVSNFVVTASKRLSQTKTTVQTVAKRNTTNWQSQPRACSTNDETWLRANTSTQNTPSSYLVKTEWTATLISLSARIIIFSSTAERLSW